MQALVKLKPKAYFSDAWNALDLVNITCFWCSIFPCNTQLGNT
jgi:hypothetical protein